MAEITRLKFKVQWKVISMVDFGTGGPSWSYEHSQRGFCEGILGFPSRKPCQRSSMQLVSLLRTCSAEKLLRRGMIVHAHILATCDEQSILLDNLLMHMYGSCGALEEAHSLFFSVSERNLFSFSIIMSAYVGHGQSMEAQSLFQTMLSQGLMPDKVVFVTLLSACCKEGSLKTGQILHVQIMCYGALHMDVYVGASLISMYNKCGDPGMAKYSFDDIVEQSTISWNALMAAHVDHGQPEMAFHLFNQMEVEGFIPDRATFLTVLHRSARLIDARLLHSCVIGLDLEQDVAIGTSFICIYGRCGCLRDASRVFDTLPDKNMISWNAYITACAHNSCAHAIQSMEQMRQQGVLPNTVSFLSVLASCRTHTVSEEVKKLHVSIVNLGYMTYVALAAVLVKAYSECNSGQDARILFDQQHEHNLVSWNTMIGSSIQHGEWDISLRLFKQLHQECYLPDKVTYTTILSGCAGKGALAEGMHAHVLIEASGLESDVAHSLLNMYAKCGALELASVQFHSICEQNVIAWNNMISAFLELEKFDQLFHLAQQMLCYGIIHTKVTYATLFTACANMVIFDEGSRFHSRISGSCLEVDTIVGNAIINMYGKNGGVTETKLMFERMEKHSLTTWNARIGSLLQHADVADAISILKEMQLEGIDPDEVTYFNILSACSHGGLLEEGIKHFMFMYSSYEIVPYVEHFNCLISLLGRAGRLDEGEKIIHNMPYTAVASSWMVLLACCNIHLDGNKARQAADIALQLEPRNAVTYVTVANSYAMTAN